MKLNVVNGKHQHHIHDKLIEIAKEKLSTTDLTVNEIAFELALNVRNHSASYSRIRPANPR